MKTFKIALIITPALKIANYKEEVEEIIYTININKEE